MNRQKRVTPKLRAAAALELRRRKFRAFCAQFRDDPIGYARAVLGWEPTRDQEAIAKLVVESRRTCVKASHAIGKCVEADEVIPLADGRMVSAKELVGTHFGVLAFDPESPHQRPVLAFAEDNGVKPVFRVTTESGRSVVRTEHHPLWSAELLRRPGGRVSVDEPQWIGAGDLREGDLVLVPTRLDTRGGRRMPAELVILMGYLLGDGGTTGQIRFSQLDGRPKDEFISIVEGLGGLVHRVDHIDLRVTGTTGKIGSNPAIQLCKEWGIYGKGARQKRFPKAAWSLPDDQLALLVNRLFACDGWAYAGKPSPKTGQGNTRVGITLASEGLIRDVELAMLRLGIIGRVRSKPTSYKGVKYEAWEWATYDAASIERFAEVVGIYGKEDRVDAVVKAACGRTEAKMHKWRSKGCPAGYRWERVKSVDSLGERPTVAISVPGPETFVTTFVEHNTGLAGVLANWWFDCFDESIVYITAPTWEQALGLTFKEVKKLRLGGCKALDPWEGMRRPLWDGPLPGVIQETGNVKDEDRTAAMSHYIKAINAERAEGFQGEHSAPILIILEEAVGVGNHIWEGAEGLMTAPECRWLAIANPTDEATEFGRATKRPTVKVHTVSVFDHPNIGLEIEAKRPLIDLAVRLRWLHDMLADHCDLADPGDPDAFEWWGLPTIEAALAGKPASKNPDAVRWWYKPNAVFEGRALGRFPGQAFEQVIPRKWLEHLPTLTPPADELPEIGCDVARHGDDRTCIATRHGPCLTSLDTLRQMDLVVVTSALRDAAATAAKGERGTYDPKSIPIRIDVTGGLGAGPADTLHAEGYAVEFVNSSESSTATDEAGNLLYDNMRSELWFACRERARKKELDLSRIPSDARLQLVDELSTPKWELTANGRKRVERKKDTKKKLKWSPDLADAVNLAFKAPGDSSTISPMDLPRWDDPWGRS